MICKKGNTEKMKLYSKRKVCELLIFDLKNIKGKIKKDIKIKDENITDTSKYELASETRLDWYMDKSFG